MSHKANTTIKTVLLAFLAIAIIAGAYRLATDDNSKGSSLIGDNDKIVACYFHKTKRCQTCNKIEGLCHQAIKENFPDKLSNKEITWKVVDMDEFKGYREKYKLLNPTIIFTKKVNGTEKFVNLDKQIWELIHKDKDALKTVVAEELEKFILEAQ